jgi:NAD(P)H-hydrate epimerase
MQDFDLKPYLSQIVLPKRDNTKGDNGRVLVIGGSKLFHAASFWTADMASHIVDMVHFSSPTMENNDLMRVKAKEKFWNGIVVPYEELGHYIEEDDCIVIGPGMERSETTKKIVNALLTKYPSKKWVVDGGALQEVDPTLLTPSMIITPNLREIEMLNNKMSPKGLSKFPCTILAKGPVDSISYLNTGSLENQKTITISGGSPGMTKGGTGDVLAGLVAGLYAKSPALVSCVVASYINKLASEELSESLGSLFSPSDLITQIPVSLRELQVS